jgi:hypothetical protein
MIFFLQSAARAQFVKIIVIIYTDILLFTLELSRGKVRIRIQPHILSVTKKICWNVAVPVGVPVCTT